MFLKHLSFLYRNNSDWR